MRIGSSQLAAVWAQVKQLLIDGYSIIPVREKAEGSYQPKTPYAGWKRYQTEIISEKELWNQMTKFDTTAIAVLGGAVSGNLEIIDIDNKNKAGVEAELFSILRSLMPNFWDKIRVHKSPSGGFHILYRVLDGVIPGNKKLASVSTDSKPKAFLETRGEGGYVLLPPSINYSVYIDNPIPTITWSERCSIITICESMDEIPRKPEEIKEPKPDHYYDINPFQDYNKSPEAQDVLINHGWTRYGENSRFIWFSRPGGSNNIHAAYLKDAALYYFFTTNSDFDPNKCYQPASVLAILEHGGDKKVTYQTLVSRGFGKIKPEVERKIILAANPNPPANLSPASQVALKEAISKRADLYPYGTFWSVDEDLNVVIDRESIYGVASGLGFRYDESLNSVVQIRSNRIYRINERYFYDSIKSYIKDERVLSAYEAFLQKAGKFTIGRIKLLEESKILYDSRHICYKFYNDVIVKITSKGFSEHYYSELDESQLLWADQVQDREFVYGDSGRYVDFLEKAVEYDKNERYIQTIIGYLAHNYKDESTAYMPILVERCEDPKHGGGSGKNLFCNLLKMTTTVTGKPGEQITYDNNLLQMWAGERIFVISDAPKDFKFAFFKELISGDGALHKKYANEIKVPAARMPKFIIQTNYSYENVDGGMKRRMIPLEFTEFFTKAEGVDVYYGIHFPMGWNREDWAGYDGTIVQSIVTWLGNGLKINQVGLSEGAWRKSFDVTYGRTCYDFVRENFDSWCEMKEIRNEDFKKQLEDYYNEKGIQKMYQPNMIKINRAIDEYATHYGYHFKSDVQRKANGVNSKYRLFIKHGEAPF